MKIEDFEPTVYACPDGSIRARRDGPLWRGEVLDAGCWKAQALGCTTYLSAIAITLVMLGLDDEEPEPVGSEIDW